MNLPDSIKKQGIKRLTNERDTLDFSNLRQQGINQLQALAGDVWTDYNLHDPGITILEQLCFGLTELHYQSKIPVADYLANERGQIEYHQYALYKPQDIFPTRPVTVEDYCKRILDAVPEIDAVRIDTVDEPGHFGACLYDISLKLLQPLTGPEYSDDYKHQVRQKVASVYAGNRNLGEDIYRIQIEQSRSCFLKGVIETTGTRNSADIYADVFFQVARKISSNIRIDRYEALALEQDLESIFNGPLTRHGYIDGEGLNNQNPGKVLDELNGLVAEIDGVKKVYHLELVDAEDKTLDGNDLTEHSYFLKFPQDLTQQTWIKIDFNPGKTTDAQGVIKGSSEVQEKLMAEAQRALQKLEFEYRAFRNNKTDTAQFIVLPQGRQRHHADYYSVQHHFPNIYGINTAGVARGETPQRKIQAQQLKAYLYPFEQLMANMQAHLHQLQELFSLREIPNHSYFAQFLDNHHIPHFAALYKDPAINLEKIQAIQSNHDLAFDRKSRALDTLLALYGETFSQEALLHFNYYHQEQPEYWAIDNKIRFLLHLVEISQNRHGAANTSQPQWQTSNLSSLHKKINILLGIQQLDSLVPLSQSLAIHNIQLVGDAPLCKKGPFPEEDSAEAVPYLNEQQQQKIQQWTYTPNKVLTLCPSMIREGTNIDAYYLRSTGNTVTVYFYSRTKKIWTELKQFPHKSQAVAYVHKFKKIITDLNSNAEGFYLLEHILLRPRKRIKAERVEDYTLITDEFFHSRISFIFPNWTARFANPAFRQFAEKTISNQLPAHLFPHIYWLDQEQIHQIDNLYRPWLTALENYESAKCSENPLDEAQLASLANHLDQLSLSVRTWLEQQVANTAYWI
jgi:hypothetical protein